VVLPAHKSQISTTIKSILFAPKGGLEYLGTPFKQWEFFLIVSLDKEVTVQGWVRTTRKQGAGTITFIELNDGSCLKCLQVKKNGPRLD
jgi:hypothetical protein